VTKAAVVLLVFAFGFATGAMALYTVWRVVVCSPTYWAKVFASIADIFPLGRWVHVKADHLCLQCPACGASESSEASE
jgi:hypothetical protein